MKFTPGERFEYNDGGYILLGMVLESITGQSFPDLIQKFVFTPAEMHDSGYFPTDQLPERTAYAYIHNPDGSWRTNFFAVPIIGAPDGGAYTTAPDLLKFWKALQTNRLLNPEMCQALLGPQITTDWVSPYTHYGYGVWIEQSNQEIHRYFAEGYDPGVALRSTVFPQENLTLTLIGNTSEALWPLYTSIEQILFDDA
jgi:CubicO group peptidase (beta-lactamase class C family)